MIGYSSPEITPGASGTGSTAERGLPAFKKIWSIEGNPLHAYVRRGTLYLNGSPIDACTGKPSKPTRFDINIVMDERQLSRAVSGGKWTSRLFSGSDLSLDLQGQVIVETLSKRYTYDALILRSSSSGTGGILDLKANSPYRAFYERIGSIRGNFSDGFLLLTSDVQDRPYTYETVILTEMMKLSPLKMFHILDANSSMRAVGWRVAQLDKTDEYGNGYWGTDYGRVLSCGNLSSGDVHWEKPHISWAGSLGDRVMAYTSKFDWVVIDSRTGRERPLDTQPLGKVAPENILTFNSVVIVSQRLDSGQTRIAGYELSK